MKRRKYIILISCISCLSLFTIHIVTAGQEELSSLTLANIEALSTDENTSSPCHAAGGVCFSTYPYIKGIHFEKD